MPTPRIALRLHGALVAVAVVVALACSAPRDAAVDSTRAGASVEATPATPLTAALSTLADDSAGILEGLRHLSSDSLQGRGTGTEGAALARSWLETALADAGVRPLDGAWEHPFSWSRRSGGESRQGVNVLGTVPGGGLSDRVIVVSAHYDHLGVRDGQIYNGADDDASGAVGLVAVARALHGVALRHTLLFAAFDAEEAGLRGSRAFVAAPPVPLGTIALDLNLDMVARTAGVLWASGAHHTPDLRPVLEDVAARAPLTLRLGHDAAGAPEGDDWTRSSDHGPFHDAGIPFVYLGVEDHPDYHRPTDDFANVDPGEYMNALRTVLLTLFALDQALPFPGAQAPSDTATAGARP